MSWKIITIFMFGFISVNGFSQIGITRDSVYNNSSIISDTMKYNNNEIDSTLNAGIIPRDSLGNDTLKLSCQHPRYYNFFKSTKPQGSISNGYEYGVSPYVFNHGVTGFYKSEGNVGFDIVSFPINVRYYYSTLNIIGLNNYFSVSFDVNRYKDNIKKKMSVYEEKYTSQVDSLLLSRQNLIQKRSYIDREIESKLNRIETAKNTDFSRYTTKDRYLNNVFSDSLLNNHLGQKIHDYSDYNVDTLIDKTKFTSSVDSTTISQGLTQRMPVKNLQTNIDSLEGIVSDYQEKSDQLKNRIKDVDSLINNIQSKIQSIKDFKAKKPGLDSGASVLGRYKQYLFDIKKFEMGLCYPSYSNFLIKGTAIKGINVEFDNDDYFVAVSHGTSVNTFVNPLNAVESNLNKFKQMFDFLDFSNQGDHRRLTSMMFGYGKKQGNHIHAGFLYGTGSANMNPYSPLLHSEDKNYVLELEGRAVINKQSYLDFSYGKSSIQGENEILESNERGFSGIFTSKRTNAALISFHTQIPKVRTNVQLSVRWLDPYFKSFGIGFLKSDNLRYEIKADQRLTKRVNVSCLYRKSEDNLLNLYDYKNKLNTFGLGASVKWSRRLSTKVNYNMILQSMDLNNQNSYSSKSYISTYILNYQIPKIKTFITGIYNDYNISDANATNRFQNVLVSGTTDVGAKFKNCFSVNMLKTNMKDSLGDNSAMLSNDIIWMQKRFLVALNGKYAFIDGRDNQFGYGIKATFTIYKSISLEGSFERIVYGSYYNYITAEQIEKFPYYCSIKLNYIWK